MIYFDQSDLGCTPYIKNWQTTLPKDLPSSCIDLFNELIELSIDKGLEFLHKNKSSLHFQLNRYNIIQSLCAIISGFVEFFHTHGGFAEPEANKSMQGSTMRLFESFDLNMFFFCLPKQMSTQPCRTNERKIQKRTKS
jgi:hypothetical protein